MDESRRTLVWALTAGGMVTIAVGIVVGIAVSAWGFAAVPFGIADFALAWAFASGRLGTGPSGSEAEPEAQAADPSYNPYARED